MKYARGTAENVLIFIEILGFVAMALFLIGIVFFVLIALIIASDFTVFLSLLMGVMLIIVGLAVWDRYR